jgi:hypothetical protein
MYNQLIEPEIFEKFVLECFNKFNNKVYFIERNEVIEFNNNGRAHTKEESIAIDNQIKELLNKHNIDYKVVKNNESVDLIVKETLESL